MTFTLIGMPASGKSSMGRALAKRLHMENVDGDRLIESVDGRPLHQILAEEGTDGFKAIEERVLLSIEGDGKIISPGGSVVYYDSVMKHFASLGKIVYLYCSLETIKRRLGDFSKRGIVLAPGQTIDDLYEERTKLYSKYADIVIDCDGYDYQTHQDRLISILKYCDENPQ